jgi:hypothetical protein
MARDYLPSLHLLERTDDNLFLELRNPLHHPIDLALRIAGDDFAGFEWLRERTTTKPNIILTAMKERKFALGGFSELDEDEEVRQESDGTQYGSNWCRFFVPLSSPASKDAVVLVEIQMDRNSKALPASAQSDTSMEESVSTSDAAAVKQPADGKISYWSVLVV